MLRQQIIKAASITNLFLLFSTMAVSPAAEASSFTTTAVPQAIVRSAALPPGFSVPGNASVISNVQAASSWKICIGSCASGAVPKSYSMHQNVASASLDSKTTGATFHESGTPYGDVMWNHTLTKTTATHFVMDFYMKIDHPENVQALEVALLKRDGTEWFKGSTQCNYKSGALRGYNPQSHSWNNLGATCVKAKANTWQHVTLQYSIVGGTTNFEAANFDSVLQNMSASLPTQHESTTSETMGVHFQLDNTSSTSGYTVSVDHWTVYSW